MINVTIKGVEYPFDNEHYPLPEAIELETVLGMTFGAWQDAVGAGSAKAAAGLVWLTLKRAGEEVPLADILSGKYPLDVGDISAVAAAPPVDPTVPPAGSGMASGNGSAPSPSSTGTPPLTSAGSPRPSSIT